VGEKGACMKILVTGAKGFIGKNLIAELRNQDYTDIFEYDRDTGTELLEYYTKECEFIFHLAGVNRPTDEQSFIDGNVSFLEELLERLKGHHNKATVLMTSSIQANLDNPYGKSKKRAEELLFAYGEVTGAKVMVYRLPNVFGKWCRPDYNSAVATFCTRIAADLPIQISDPKVLMNLVYIDDVMKEFIRALKGNEYKSGSYCKVEPVHTMTLGEIADSIKSFKKSREELSIPNMSEAITKKLYSTYLSYLPVDSLSYALKMNEDKRGSFTEFIRTPDRGQIAVNISKKGITKGNHWHHTKNEKFLVVSGKGCIHLRKIDSDEVISYYVSGEKLEVIDIPVGYTHNIINEGEGEMVTVMWANTAFDVENPDTYYLEV
jgi:UDP-2-acetamido-2,6-beta-L-arabino-hexul-4-ose reductase